MMTPPFTLCCTGEHKEKWADTKVFPNYQAMLEDAGAKPDAAFIGLPPKYHGALEDKSANIEVVWSSCKHRPPSQLLT